MKAHLRNVALVDCVSGWNASVLDEKQIKYLLDNPGVTKDKKVLDLGSGCGASSIAARLSGASQVLANDIDPVATIVTTLNCELNGMKPFPVVSKNLIGTKPENLELILLGDMFHEQQLADRLHCRLRECIRTHRTQVLIGDPGRVQFEGHTIRQHLQKLAGFQLPDSVREQNYGLTTFNNFIFAELYFNTCENT
ncbi:Protein N-lysine methyltransferase METTL20 [Acipenser ruthenus]|uniref:Electron transfer flavoprotein beta subunit lysine methyltransferase n=1 Tax=Acipenser ruthenus TaxID=7906 RepID=A0A444UC21_ACIRT|nr:Protein N-lysine methyltransferase METTL20 [Acipenser ruthenus]